MPFDQPLKELLRAFFAEFMTSFFPEAAARLDLNPITFLEKETSTDLCRGRRREMDLVAQAARRDGTTQEELSVLFRYRRLRLKGIKAAEAVRQGGPLVGALAVLMDRRGADPVELKVASLERIGTARLDEARRWLLSSFVEQFLPLSGDEEQRFGQLVSQEEHRMAKLADYEAWREAQRREGQLQAKQEDVLTVLRTRFAPVSAEWERRVAAINTLPELDALFLRLLKASSLDEVE